jgi:hypothetical protein
VSRPIEPQPTSEKYRELHLQYIRELAIVKSGIDSEIRHAIDRLACKEFFYSTMRNEFNNIVDLIEKMKEEARYEF